MIPNSLFGQSAVAAAFSLGLLSISPDSKADTFAPYEADEVPQTVEALWADIDPAAEPLEVKVVKEWEEEGITYRYLLYTVCTFEDTPCRVAALYIFPTGASNAPAFVWAHGGGQRAEQKRGQYFAGQGYASIDINWGGREVLEGVEENTDWGTLDPSQGPQFYPEALRSGTKLNLDPDEHTIDAVPSPRNGNWFLLALAGRRAITFLEQQPEVDPDRIGFTGYSMGGNITSYCAIDPRLKAVAPMVGGTGFKMEDFPGIPESSNLQQYRHPDLYSATIDSEAYWPLVKAPVLFLNATNDFHGIIDRSYRCVDLLPHDNWNATYNLHYNHSLRSEQYAGLKLFFDEHLAENTMAPRLP
ncbi:MAG: dienelactone hydrolase family protein [Verrucomicrobiota bacterium]